MKDVALALGWSRRRPATCRRRRSHSRVRCNTGSPPSQHRVDVVTSPGTVVPTPVASCSIPWRLLAYPVGVVALPGKVVTSFFTDFSFLSPRRQAYRSAIPCLRRTTSLGGAHSNLAGPAKPSYSAPNARWAIPGFSSRLFSFPFTPYFFFHFISLYLFCLVSFLLWVFLSNFFYLLSILRTFSIVYPCADEQFFNWW